MTDWWRLKVKELLPELAELAADPEETAFLFFSELVELTLSALRRSDEKSAARYFAFARLSLSQKKEEDAHQAACCCFYEYVFKDKALAKKVARHIEQAVFEKIEPFLRFAYNAEEFISIKRAVDERHH